jgi:hypothetical protein
MRNTVKYAWANVNQHEKEKPRDLSKDIGYRFK